MGPSFHCCGRDLRPPAVGTGPRTRQPAARDRPGAHPDVSRPRLVRDATFLEADRREIALRRGPHNRLGFAYQFAFVRVLGRFPQQAPLEIDGEILRFAGLQLSADAETIHAYARRQQTVSEHQQRIGQYLRLRTFDTAAGEQLARFLERCRPAVIAGMRRSGCKTNQEGATRDVGA